MKTIISRFLVACIAFQMFPLAVTARPQSMFFGMNGGGPKFISGVVASTGSSGGTTGAINTTGATLLVLSASQYQTGAITVSSSPANTWTALTAHTFTGRAGTTLYYAANPTTSSSQTFTVTGASVYVTIVVAAFSGTALTSPFDSQQNGTSAGSSVTSVQPGSITPARASNLVITSVATSVFPISNSFTISSPYVIVAGGGYLASNYMSGAMAYQIRSTTAATNPTWSWTGTATTEAAAIASFKGQ